MRLPARTLLRMCVIAIALAGCSGDSGQSTSETTTAGSTTTDTDTDGVSSTTAATQTTSSTSTGTAGGTTDGCQLSSYNDQLTCFIQQTCADATRRYECQSSSDTCVCYEDDVETNTCEKAESIVCDNETIEPGPALLEAAEACCSWNS